MQCMVAEYLFESLARVPVRGGIRLRVPVSQSDHPTHGRGHRHLPKWRNGRHACRHSSGQRTGAHVFGVCNVVGSSIARETHAGAYTHAGPEIGVASTKAFTAQVAVLTVLAMHLAASIGTPDRRPARSCA